MKYRIIEPKIPGLEPYKTVLTNRGLNLQDIDRYLKVTSDEYLDPALIANIKEGVTLLIKHIQAGHDIFIQVDSDADGLTSAALLINYLYNLFPSFVQNNIIYRLHNGKQHGLTIRNLSIVILSGRNRINEWEGIVWIIKDQR